MEDRCEHLAAEAGAQAGALTLDWSPAGPRQRARAARMRRRFGNSLMPSTV
ncbi:MAG: hypothetical protein ACLSTO_04310 [Bilophila wadsworthia]